MPEKEHVMEPRPALILAQIRRTAHTAQRNRALIDWDDPLVPAEHVRRALEG